MKQLLPIVAIITTIITGTSCKKEYSPTNVAADQKQPKEQNARASCLAPCPHVVAYYLDVLSTTNNRTKMRLYIQYYYVSDKNGKFNVTIKTQTNLQITIGRFAVDNILPTASETTYRIIEKDFIFPANLSAYPSYRFFINGQSPCDDACSTYMAYYPNLPL